MLFNEIFFLIQVIDNKRDLFIETFLFLTRLFFMKKQ